MRRSLTNIEVFKLGSLLTELSTNPDYAKIGYELLTQEVNLQIKPETPITLHGVKRLVLDLGLNDYFASKHGPGARKRQDDAIEQRLQKLEADLETFKERLGICEKKWIEHIVPKHEDSSKPIDPFEPLDH